MPACPNCARSFAAGAVVCPHCGAGVGAAGYEWRSARSWLDVPLVHVAFGRDAQGKVRVARGVIAIGQQAVGVVAVGIVARGVIAVGLVALGLVALGFVSVAAVALGVNAVGAAAFGVVAAGYMAGGVAPIGWKILFSVGGVMR